MPIEITDPGDERVRDYFALTDVALRTKVEPARGLYLAESEKVIRRALGAGHRPRSFLMGQRWLTDLADLVGHAESGGVPVYVAEAAVIQAMTGVHLHRGALASMHRRLHAAARLQLLQWDSRRTTGATGARARLYDVGAKAVCTLLGSAGHTPSHLRSRAFVSDPFVTRGSGRTGSVASVDGSSKVPVLRAGEPADRRLGDRQRTWVARSGQLSTRLPVQGPSTRSMRCALAPITGDATLPICGEVALRGEACVVVEPAAGGGEAGAGVVKGQ
ncbi:MAG: hypothetical protein ACYCV4_14655 [Dermatophilaceae bacterium]